MNTARTPQPSAPSWPAVVGAAVWVLTITAGGAQVVDLTLLDAMLLLGVVVVIPAAVPLHPAARRTWSVPALAAGLPLVPALLLEPGAGAALLATPWVLATIAGAVLAAWSWFRTPRLLTLVWPLAAGYLAFGALWVLADRLDLSPAGFGPPFVQLTAIHFHYAGFVSAVLAGCILVRLPGQRLAMWSGGAIVTAPPLIAVGFALVAPLQIAGAALLTAGLWGLAWLTLRRVVPHADRRTAVLLSVSSLSVIVPMVLAVQWAMGNNLGTPALSIPDMARYHGIVNAVGFALLGVIGWRLLEPPVSRHG